MKIENVKADELKFAKYNPREITDKSFDDLKNSIRKFGFVEPVVVNSKNNEIIGGHMRVRAAKDMGMEEVPVKFVDLTEKEAKVLNLALNRIQGRWDADKLSKLITELETVEGVELELSGFEDWELDYYNVGPTELEEDLDLDNLTGVQPNESYILSFVFDNEDDAKSASTFFNDGKYIKNMDGKKLLELVYAERKHEEN